MMDDMLVAYFSKRPWWEMDLTAKMFIDELVNRGKVKFQGNLHGL